MSCFRVESEIHLCFGVCPEPQETMSQCVSCNHVLSLCFLVFVSVWLSECSLPEEGRGRWLGGRGWDQGVGGRGAPTSLNVTFSSARPEIFTLYYSVVGFTLFSNEFFAFFLESFSLDFSL